jgi:hypothetical protein
MIRYQHYKGGTYNHICEATLESDPTVTMIVYQASNGSILTRPKNVFFAIIEHQGTFIPRFQRIEEDKETSN